METAKTGQKLIQSNGQSWLLVGVPEGATNFSMTGMGDIYFQFINKNGQVSGGDQLSDWDWIELTPPGSYTLYGKGSDLTMLQKFDILERDNDASGQVWFKIYGEENDVWTKNSDHSLESLLTHHQFKPNGCVILKVVK